MADDGSTQYDCVLQFGDNDPKFTYGFQAGQVWSKMDTGEPFEEMICGEILELVQRMGPRKNYRLDIKLVGDDWYSVQATPNS